MTKAKGKPVILVPVDFFPASQAALLKACEWAECLDARIVVLHVVHEPSDMPSYFSAVLKKKHLVRIEDAAKQMCDDFIKQLTTQYPKVGLLNKLECMLVKGIPVSRILQVADKLDAYMLVMGSKGMTGLQRLMLGSVAERVVQLCPHPVAVVKAIEEEGK